ncbi:hypothetical protein [Brucella sp.]|uniref:hypothetical protein n=1 Tax=Brucella sp. TaxID=52132 RepID=UPI0028AF2E28|nr:hypothetical protein [Brucella sp.]
MAVLPDYVSGTITVTQGDVNFTGTNTLWRTMGFREGDTVQLQGFTAIIKGTSEFGNPIDSNVAGQFVEPWPGQSGTFAYRMRFLPDGARFAGKSTNLIELLGNGVLANLAELGVEDGKTPVGNAAGQYELKPTSGFGIQDPTGSLGQIAALTLAANKALATDGSGNAQQIDLGTLGRALLALANGTSAQYVRADGTLQTLNAATVGLGNVNNTSDANKPVSTATQTALDDKYSKSGGQLSGSITMKVNETSGTTIRLFNGNTANYGFYIFFDHGGGVADNGLKFAHTFSGVRATLTQAGNFNIVGTLSKAGGTFLIDHPLDPFNKNLRHGFVESTEYVNIYRGMVDLVDGRMIIDIDAAFGMTDGTFAALNSDVMVTSLQNQYGPDRVWVEAPAESGKFTIVCEDEHSTATIAWMVTGRRNDAFVRSDLDPNTDSEGRFIPEFDKEDA